LNDNSLRSRRSVLRFGAGAAATFGLSNLAPISQAASSLNRSSVCLYLLGGNDSNNMVVPLDSPGYDLYAKGRGSLAIPRNALLSVYSSNASAAFGFHPSLPGIQDLYNQGVLGVMANVGRAALPVNRAGVKSNPRTLPSDLFEHGAASHVRYLPNGYMTLSWAPGAATPVALLEHGVTVSSSEALPAPGGQSKRLAAGFPQTPTGQLLESVANFLKLGPSGQQLFVCPVSGFDTHGNQLARQADLFSELDSAVGAFYRAVQDLGIADRVTLFTQTEFNRTLAPNAHGGTEHAWGGHQLILGRSVLGGQVYGRFPALELGGTDDAGTSGIWIPSTSDLQYAATLASWLGRSDLQGLPEFAGLRQFAETDLGFLAK
jgi:uncharacterized protein (DUF1501 family)